MSCATVSHEAPESFEYIRIPCISQTTSLLVYQIHTYIIYANTQYILCVAIIDLLSYKVVLYESYRATFGCCEPKLLGMTKLAHRSNVY